MHESVFLNSFWIFFYSDQVFCGCVIWFLGSNPSLSFVINFRIMWRYYQCDSDLNLACLWEGEFPRQSLYSPSLSLRARKYKNQSVVKPSLIRHRMRVAVGWQWENVSSYYNELKYSCYSKHEYKQHVEFVSRHFTILYLKLQRLETLHNLQYFPSLSVH